MVTLLIVLAISMATCIDLIFFNKVEEVILEPPNPAEDKAGENGYV